MQMRKKILFFLILFSMYIIDSGAANSKLTVVVSVEPMAYILKKIAGDKIDIITLIDQGKNPHSYTPSPGEISKLYKASSYLTIGAPFESVIVSKLNKKNGPIIVALDEGVKRRAMTDKHNHAHESTHKHEHKNDHVCEHGKDPHIWLSSTAILQMLEVITDHLGKIDEKNKSFFINNKKKFQEELSSVVSGVKQQLDPLKGKKVFVFHPAFGYFLDEYGLQQEAVELEGKMPSPRHVRKLIDLAKKEKTKIIFAQPQFSRKAAETIAKGINGQVSFINPLEYDILNNFKFMADAITKAYE